MAKIRIIRRQDKGYIELPPDLARNDELELFQLKDGFYLLSIQLGAQGAPEARPQAAGISGQERAVLKKLLSIKFENRTPAYVSKALGEDEKAVLGELERKGLVSVFKGRKYADGVYSVKDSAYSLAQGAEAKPQQAQRAPPQEGVQAQPQGNTLGILNSRGYIIITDKREALMLSELLNGQMKSGAVVGVKGFDGKFYVVTRDYFNSSQAKVAQALKEEMDAPSVAGAAKLDPEGCLAVLRLMAENGEIIEKKRGVFAPV